MCRAPLLPLSPAGLLQTPDIVGSAVPSCIQKHLRDNVAGSATRKPRQSYNLAGASLRPRRLVSPLDLEELRREGIYFVSFTMFCSAWISIEAM